MDHALENRGETVGVREEHFPIGSLRGFLRLSARENRETFPAGPEPRGEQFPIGSLGRLLTAIPIIWAGKPG